jgi:hypothetical protein
MIPAGTCDLICHTSRSPSFDPMKPEVYRSAVDDIETAATDACSASTIVKIRTALLLTELLQEISLELEQLRRAAHQLASRARR